MAHIQLKDIGQSYDKENKQFVLRNINIDFKDGVSYALLGPSGCGKSTLLNIISGLITPTEGQVIVDGQDMTNVFTSKRHIAQVFQFPVVYDTMTVYENFAFPLKNHHYPEEKIQARVEKIAKMLDLTDSLHEKANNLSADVKQKISLGRSLVREDVNVIMFDEPLTVIDPHLKWEILIKLKEIHNKVSSTLIYVTHDQTEALAFADEVIVVHDGEIVQIGTPTELFKQSNHSFVGHFIGSPGMNIIVCDKHNDTLFCLGLTIHTTKIDNDKIYELGIRPEYIHFSEKGLLATIQKVQNLGRMKILSIQVNGISLKMVIREFEEIPDKPYITFAKSAIHLFQNHWLINEPIQLEGIHNE